MNVDKNANMNILTIDSTICKYYMVAYLVSFRSLALSLCLCPSRHSEFIRLYPKNIQSKNEDINSRTQKWSHRPLFFLLPYLRFISIALNVRHMGKMKSRMHSINTIESILFFWFLSWNAKKNAPTQKCWRCLKNNRL